MISTTAYGSGVSSLTAPYTYSGTCAVRTMAAGASYIMIGAGAAALTASIALFWET